MGKIPENRIHRANTLTLLDDVVLLRLRRPLPTSVGRELNKRLSSIGFKWKPNVGWEIPLNDLLNKKGKKEGCDNG